MTAVIASWWHTSRPFDISSAAPSSRFFSNATLSKTSLVSPLTFLKASSASVSQSFSAAARLVSSIKSLIFETQSPRALAAFFCAPSSFIRTISSSFKSSGFFPSFAAAFAFAFCSQASVSLFVNSALPFVFVLTKSPMQLFIVSANASVPASSTARFNSANGLAPSLAASIFILSSAHFLRSTSDSSLLHVSSVLVSPSFSFCSATSRSRSLKRWSKSVSSIASPRLTAMLSFASVLHSSFDSAVPLRLRQSFNVFSGSCAFVHSELPGDSLHLVHKVLAVEPSLIFAQGSDAKSALRSCFS